MTLLVSLGVFVLLFPTVVFYCFEHRTISKRAGAFYLLLASVGCAVAVVSSAVVYFPRLAERLIQSDEPPAEDLLAVPEGSPSGAGIVAGQAPEFPKPGIGENVEAWTSWQERLRSRLINEIYELDLSSPAALPPPDRLLLRETADQSLIRKEFAIPAADGDSIPAVLLLPPDAADPLPGILFLPGHVDDDAESGLGQLVLPIDSYQNAAARELALAGFATLTIELRGFGLRGPPAYPDHRIVAYNAILSGSFYKKLAFHDIKRTLDFFETLSEIDADRIGISGVSLGGEIAVEYAGLDERIRAISFHAHGGHVGPYGALANPAAAQPHYCHIVPGVNELFYQEDPFLLLAPRATQGIRGENRRRPDFIQSLQQVWALMNKPDLLELQMSPRPGISRGHTYSVTAAVQFFKKQL